MTDNNKNIEIIPLPKEQWKGTPIPLVTKTDSYYDLEISPLDKDGCKINLIKKPFEKQVVHSPEEYDFPDGLYQDHWENAEAYGVVSDDGKMLACIEVCPEEWSNRLMVTELWITEELRGQGLGKQVLLDVIDYAKSKNLNRVILDADFRNVGARKLYERMGFKEFNKKRLKIASFERGMHNMELIL